MFKLICHKFAVVIVAITLLFGHNELRVALCSIQLIILRVGVLTEKILTRLHLYRIPGRFHLRNQWLVYFVIQIDLRILRLGSL